MFFSFKEYLNFARFLVSRELTLQTRKREGCFAFAGNRVRTGHKNLESQGILGDSTQLTILL